MEEDLELRRALDALTDLTAEQHLAAVMNIKGHGITLYRRCAVGNCLSRALMASDCLHSNYLELVAKLFASNTDEAFLDWLRDHGHLAKGANGALALYYEDESWRHAGVRQQDGTIISKWGVGWYIYRHGSCELPLRYGHPRFFEKPDERRALDLFIEFTISTVGEGAFAEAFPAERRPAG